MKYLLLLLICILVGCESYNPEELSKREGWTNYQYVQDRYLITDKHGDMYLTYVNSDNKVTSKTKVRTGECKQIPVVHKDGVTVNQSSDVVALQAEIKLLKYKLENCGLGY